MNVQMLASKSEFRASEANPAQGANLGYNKHMAKPHFDGQHDDEEVLLVIRRHPIVMRKGLLILLIILLFSMVPLLIWPTNLQLFWIVGLGLILGSLAIFYYWIGWYFSLFIVTDQRFVKIIQEGLFKRSVV